MDDNKVRTWKLNGGASEAHWVSAIAYNSYICTKLAFHEKSTPRSDSPSLLRLSRFR